MSGACTGDVVIRPLGEQDVIAYRDLMLEAYADPPADVLPAFASTRSERAAQPQAWWRERIAGPLAASFGAFRDGALHGAVALAFNDRTRTSHCVQLVGMFVRPGVRGLGVGADLVRTALAHAQARGALVVRLAVVEDNLPALRLYQRLGFATYGKEPMAMRHGNRFITTVHLQRTLDAR